MNEQLKAFDKVLVRNNSEDEWRIALFSYASRGNACEDFYVCICGSYYYCIPYEGNEHLLGTTDAPTPKRWRAEKGESIG